jgi:hypothetical protein
MSPILQDTKESKKNHDKVLFIYLTATEGAISAALVRDDEQCQKHVYCTLRILRDVKICYPPLKKNSICIGDRFTKATPVFLSPPLLSSHQGTAKKGTGLLQGLPCLRDLMSMKDV